MRTAILLACLVLAGLSVIAAEPGKDSRHPFKRHDAEATFAWLCLRTDRLDDTAHDDELESIRAEVVGCRFHWVLRVQEGYIQHVGENQIMRVRFLPLVKTVKVGRKTRLKTALWIEPDLGGRKVSPVPTLQVTFDPATVDELKPGRLLRLHAQIKAVRLEGNPTVGWSYHFQVGSVRLWKVDEPDW